MARSRHEPGRRTLPWLRLFGECLNGKWIGFGCPRCNSIWLIRKRDMDTRLKVNSVTGNEVTRINPMPCPVCFRTGRIE